MTRNEQLDKMTKGELECLVRELDDRIDRLTNATATLRLYMDNAETVLKELAKSAENRDLTNLYWVAKTNRDRLIDRPPSDEGK